MTLRTVAQRMETIDEGWMEMQSYLQEQLKSSIQEQLKSFRAEMHQQLKSSMEEIVEQLDRALLKCKCLRASVSEYSEMENNDSSSDEEEASSEISDQFSSPPPPPPSYPPPPPVPVPGFEARRGGILGSITLKESIQSTISEEKSQYNSYQPAPLTPSLPPPLPPPSLPFTLCYTALKDEVILGHVINGLSKNYRVEISILGPQDLDQDLTWVIKLEEKESPGLVKATKKTLHPRHYNMTTDSPPCRRIILFSLDFSNSVEPTSASNIESLKVAGDSLSGAFKTDSSPDSSVPKPDSLIQIFTSYIGNNESKSDQFHEKFQPDWLPFLFQYSQSSQDHREVALILFNSLSESFGDSFQPYFADLQALLLKCPQYETSNGVVVATLKTVGFIIEFTHDVSELITFREIILNILKVSKECFASGDKDATLIAFEMLDELVEAPTPLLGESVKAIVQFLLEVCSSLKLDSSTRHQAIQIILRPVKNKSNSLDKNKLITLILPSYMSPANRGNQ